MQIKTTMKIEEKIVSAIIAGIETLYGQQVTTCPPTFNIYCNHAELIENSYMRYLENSFRRAWDFKGTPIKIQFKNKNED